MSNFKPVTNFWFWCQKVLPLVYDDSISYYEVLLKMSDYLNQVINNVNALPDIIDEAIKEYIESGDIQNALNAMLQNFNPINVKNPPAGLVAAKGDGETDDTAALQAMIEYGAKNNLPMIFPAGVYRVTALNVPESAYFWGVGNPTIFKAPNSEGALINATGNFTAFNMNFNGNIAGNIAPADIITGTAENISLAQCNFTGCVSGVDASVSGILDVAKCHFSNYTDYAIHAEGTGQLVIDGMVVDNVANSGAMRFVRIDTSNSIVKNLTSLASVPIGVEITGDFNSVEARIPNCENPVNDGGQNNSFDIIGQTVQKKVTGKMAYAASESEETMGTKKIINAEDIVLNPTNPLTYKTPTAIDGDKRGYIAFKDNDNNEYLIPTFVLDYIKNFGLQNYKTIFEYGAVGDGVHDDTQAFLDALADTECNVTFIPSGRTYVIQNGNYTGTPNHIFMTDGPIDGTNFTGTIGELIPTEPGWRIIDMVNDTWSGERKTYFFRPTEPGTKGFTKHAAWYQGIDQSESSNFCWTLLVTMDAQEQNESDDVALYVQTNGAEGIDNSMWGIALENNERSTTNPTRSKIGIEVLLRAHGDDSNKMRHGIHITLIPHENSVGARFGSHLLLSGGDTGASPGYVTSCIMLATLTADAFFSIRDTTDVVELTRGFDFTGMQIEKAAILLSSDKILQFQNISLKETNGQLQILRGGEQNIVSGSIFFDSSDLPHLMLGKVDITMSPVGWSGATGVTTALPVTIDGQAFYLPLYSS